MLYRNTVLIATLLVMSATLCLWGQDVQPLPFSFMTVDGRVWAPGPENGLHRLSFDVDFRLHDMSNGIQPLDSCTIQTQLAYPTMAFDQAPGPASFFSLPLVRMILRVSVAENCFLGTEDDGMRFRMTNENRECVEAVLDLAEVSGPGDSADGLHSTFLDLTPILRRLEIVFSPRDRKGRWRMTSKADFFNPGYPFAVVGFGLIPGHGPAGTSLVVGDDGGLAPFGGMVFEGSSGEDGGPCVPVRPRTAGQGFWKRQCKGPHPAGENLEEYLPLVTMTETFASLDSVEKLCSELSPRPSSDKCEQAEGQFMALLLNLASGRLAPCNCVREREAETVAEAVHLLDQWLADPDRTKSSCTRAKDLADRLNRGDSIVPCSFP